MGILAQNFSDCGKLLTKNSRALCHSATARKLLSSSEKITATRVVQKLRDQESVMRVAKCTTVARLCSQNIRALIFLFDTTVAGGDSRQGIV
jgi:hypothetical protein